MPAAAGTSTSTKNQDGGVRIVPASTLSPAALVDLFNRSYSDYFVPVALTEAALATIAAAWDIDLDGSRVALRGEAPVGFTFLAVRGRRGWIAGMGVPPEARGGGRGRATLDAVLDVARTRGLDHVDLEVLEANGPAIRIYERCGFVDRRRLDVLTRPPAPPPAAVPPGEGFVVEPVPVARCFERYRRLHPDGSPWQRDLPVLERQRDRLEALGLTRNGRLHGWVLLLGDQERAQIQDVALSDEAGDAYATALVGAALATRPEATFRFLNLPHGARVRGAFDELGFEVEWTQREMSVALTPPDA